MKKQTTPLHFRQGDVLIERIDKLPETAKRQRVKGPIILAHGEVTGHAHAIKRGTVTLYKDPAQEEKDGVDAVGYLEIAEAMALLEHEEHAPIPLPPGVYRFRRQREYSPQEIRRVAD